MSSISFPDALTAAGQLDICAVQAWLDAAPPDPDLVNKLVAKAAELNDVACLTLLLPLAQPVRDGYLALKAAVRYNHQPSMALILAEGVSNDGLHGAVSVAIREGQPEVVGVLLPQLRWGNAIERQNILGEAARQGQAACLRVLTEHGIEPIFPIALSIACTEGHQACVDILAPLSDVAATWGRFIQIGCWQAADFLAPYVSLDQIQQAIVQAPVDTPELPRARARWEESLLRHEMPESQEFQTRRLRL